MQVNAYAYQYMPPPTMHWALTNPHGMGGGGLQVVLAHIPGQTEHPWADTAKIGVGLCGKLSGPELATSSPTVC